MTLPLDDRASDLREIFFETALELLQTLNEDGLALERGSGSAGDDEAIRRVRRVVHTLKGDSAAIGMRELSELAHDFEDVLTPELAAERSADVAEAVLIAADTFESMLTAARKNLPQPSGEPLRVLVRKLCAAPAAGTATTTRGAPPTRLNARFDWNEYERAMIGEASAKGESVYHAAVLLDTTNLMPAAAWQLVRNVLHSCGSILALHPADDAQAEHVDTVEAAISSSLPVGALRKRLQIPAVTCEVVVEAAAAPVDPLHELLSLPHSDAQEAAIPPAASSVAASAAPGPAGQLAAAGPASRAAALADKTFRVDSERIDDVLNLVGELIIGKSMLSRTVAEFDRRFQRDPLAARFADALGFQTRVLDVLQKSVMKIRMVPVEQLFRRFPRVVRDIAKVRRKDVALSVSGESTDLDKSILEPLAEPITHLIRNCVDHGIEPPEERIAAGKPARGTIRLSARHEGNHVVIEVGDDGRGIKRDMIVNRAIELGFITPQEAANLTDMEALGLIFIQGFTMLREVTQISGRGVGMDVVKTALEKLKGSVGVITTPGKGTTFLLQLPLTLASIKALLAEVGGQLYAIPVASVVEITRVTEAEVHEVDNHEVFQLRNQVLKLVRLDRLSAGASRAAARSRRLFVIVVAIGDRRFGLGVDNLRGEEELVMKALDSRLTQSEFVNGASILGDGTVVMILNLPVVVSKLSRLVLAEAVA